MGAAVGKQRSLSHEPKKDTTMFAGVEVNKMPWLSMEVNDRPHFFGSKKLSQGQSSEESGSLAASARAEGKRVPWGFARAPTSRCHLLILWRN